MEKYTLITGASSGIGRSIALAFAKEGRKLVLTADKNKDGLLQTKELALKEYAKAFGDIPASYYECETFICDVADPKAADNLFDELDKKEFRIEALINNAGISCFELVQDMSVNTWQRVMNTNLSGAFYMCRKVIPEMIRVKKGCIINVSSYWGIAGSAMESAYSASKGGLNAFTLSLAKELKESNIRVNAIACEFVDTKMNSLFNNEEVEDILKEMPSGRVIDPEEIADMAARLIRPECTVTGQILGMDKLKASFF